MTASINIVTKEQVIEAFNVSVLAWAAPQIEESHQVLVLSMNVSEYLDRCVDSEYHWLLFEHFLALFRKSNDMLASESEIAIAVELCGPLSGSQQVVQEKRVKRVNCVALLPGRASFCVAQLLLAFIHEGH